MGILISKNSRKTTGSVEQLKQGSFTAVKGIDETTSALNTESVLHLENLDVDFDGGLTLRKPIVCISNPPKPALGLDNTLIKCFNNYIFDKDYILNICIASDGTQYFGIFKNNKPVKVRLVWVSWNDYSEYNVALTAVEDVYFKIPQIDFSNVHIANTATSTVLTGCFVDILSKVFKRSDADYPDDVSTDLCYSKLYDIKSNNSLFKARTLILAKSTSFAFDLDLKIVTPDLNTLNTSDTLTLDVNLDLDNPYALRDVYNTSAPSVKNILAYVPIQVFDNTAKVSYGDVSAVSESTVQNSSVLNAGYNPTFTFDSDGFQTADYRYKFLASRSDLKNKNCVGIRIVPSRNIDVRQCIVRHGLALNLWLGFAFRGKPIAEVTKQALYRISISNPDSGGTSAGDYLNSTVDQNSLRSIDFAYTSGVLDEAILSQYISNADMLTVLKNIPHSEFSRILNSWFSSNSEYVYTGIDSGEYQLYALRAPYVDSSFWIERYGKSRVNFNNLIVEYPVFEKGKYTVDTVRTVRTGTYGGV